jgi:GNAT superfamily N-acetyltransferase
MELQVLSEPEAGEREAILAALAAFNASTAPTQAGHLAVLLREDGATVGGLWASCLYDWLAIELVFVPEQARGQGTGSELLRQAEEAAQARGCIGAWLDTFSFQARGFYEKLGYRVAGEIADHPRGGTRYFLSKRFV